MKRFFKKIGSYVSLALVLVFFLGFTASAATSFPKPTNLKYVNDYAGTLDDSSKSFIVSVGKELEDKTGAQMTVVVVKSLEGRDIDSYANELFRKWAIGQKDKNNGLLVLLSMNDRKWRVEVGKGLEGAVTDIYSSRVMEKVAKPLFQQKKYGEGLSQVVAIFADDIAKEYNVTLEKNRTVNINRDELKSRNQSSSSGAPVVVFVILGLFLIDVIFNRARVTRTLLELLFWNSFFGGGGRGGGNSGGFGGGGDSGGFGGFGGGDSGGGGSSGGW